MLAKKVKTCLRYPGGKFYGFKKIASFLEINHDEYIEPFIGGASIFLGKKLSKNNWLNDVDKDLINFYKIIENQSKSKELYKLLDNEYVDKYRYEQVKNFTPKNKIEEAFKYFYLNRTSFSGIMHKPRWGYRIGSSVTPDKWVNRIDQVALKMRGTKLTCLDFREVLIKASQKTLIYADPPYYKASKYIYKNEFNMQDHSDLVDILKHTTSKFILSYNYHEDITKMYSWANISQEDWVYYMSGGKRDKGNELIITNF